MKTHPDSRRWAHPSSLPVAKSRPILRQACTWILVAVIYLQASAFLKPIPEMVYLSRLVVLIGAFLILISWRQEASVWQDLLRYIKLPLILYGCFCAFIFLQSFNGLKIFKSSAIGSIHPAATFEALIQFLFYLLFFLNCAYVFMERQETRKLISAVAILAFLIALIGALKKIAPELFVFSQIRPPFSYFFRTFPNENHFGGFLGLLFPLFLSVLFYRWQSLKSENKESRARGIGTSSIWIQVMDTEVPFLALLTFFTFAICVISRARGPFIAIFIACAAYFLFTDLRKNPKFLAIFFALFFLFPALALYSLGGINEKGILGISNPREWIEVLVERQSVALQSLEIGRAYPWFGTGWGAYRFISSKYVQESGEELQWYHAHNDYVQFLTEVGITGFFLLSAAFFLLLFKAWIASRKTSSSWIRLMIGQGFLAFLIVAMMEFFDFHLQVSAVALLFTMQLALITAVAFQEHQNQTGESKRALLQLRMISWFFALGIAGTVFYLGYENQNQFDALKAIEKSSYQGLLSASERRPRDPDTWYHLGKVSFQKYRSAGLPAHDRRRIRTHTKIALRKAALLAPTNAIVWFNVGNLEYAMGDQEDALQAFEKAHSWAPYKAQFFFRLLKMYFSQFDAEKNPKKRQLYLDRAQAAYTRYQELPHVSTLEKLAERWLDQESQNRLKFFKSRWYGPPQEASELIPEPFAKPTQNGLQDEKSSNS